MKEKKTKEALIKEDLPSPNRSLHRIFPRGGQHFFRAFLNDEISRNKLHRCVTE